MFDSRRSGWFRAVVAAVLSATMVAAGLLAVRRGQRLGPLAPAGLKPIRLVLPATPPSKVGLSAPADAGLSGHVVQGFAAGVAAHSPDGR
jgi:hypothetical protein